MVRVRLRPMFDSKGWRGGGGSKSGTICNPIANIEFTEPIVRESVAEKVVRRILGIVAAGALQAGDALPLARAWRCC